MRWSSNNATGAFASPLKLPSAEYRNLASGSLSAVVGVGSYWSSTVSDTGSRQLYFNGGASMNDNSRAEGNCVRCLKD